MDNDEKALLIFAGCFVLAVGIILFSPLFHIDDMELTINSEDISSYDVDKDIITVVMNNGSIYEIKISEDYIDFTVNSKLYINLYKSDWAYWFWEKPWYGEKWHIGTIIKIPDNMEDR